MCLEKYAFCSIPYMLRFYKNNVYLKKTQFSKCGSKSLKRNKNSLIKLLLMIPLLPPKATRNKFSMSNDVIQ